MISVQTPGGAKNIAALSILTPDGAKNIALASILTPDGDAVLWSGAGGAFEVLIDPSPAMGAIAQDSAGSVTTNLCTATPLGGVAPYTYLWTKTEGSDDWIALASLGQSTAFRCSEVPAGESGIATFEVTVTDSRGRTGTASVGAYVSNYGGLSGF